MARIESFTFDETHTYVVIKDSKGREYVLDAWSGIAFQYDSDVEWNEAMPSVSARKAGAFVSAKTTWGSEDLRALWPQLTDEKVMKEKNGYQVSVLNRVAKSYGLRFFVSESKHKVDEEKDAAMQMDKENISPNINAAVVQKRF